MLRVLPSFAHNDLDDFAVLSKIVVAAQRVKETVFSYGRGEAGNVDEVLLNDTQPCEMFAAERVGLGLLRLLLPYLRILFGLLRYLLLVFGHPR